MDVDNSGRLSSSEETYDFGCGSDGYVEDSADDELCSSSDSLLGIQLRAKASKARWIENLGMAEVLEKRGKTWISTGIERNGKTYCLLEETLYLAEIGALSVLNDDDELLQLSDIYGKLAEGKNSYGCSWEFFEVYRHLKFLGYIVGRHGTPWSLKKIQIRNDAEEGTTDSDRRKDEGAADNVIEMFGNLMLSETRHMFDVYPPDRKFKKSSPGSPSFILCLTSGQPPSKLEIEDLETNFADSPLKFCIVEHGRVNFLSFTKVDLPILS